MPFGLPPTAMAQGARNASVMMVIVLAVASLGAVAIALASGRTFGDAWNLALNGGMYLMAAAFFVSLIVSRRRGGRVVLDCGPHPMQRWFQATAVLFIVGGTLLVVGEVMFGDPSTLTPLSASFFLLAPLLYLSLSVGRLQIVEHGLWMYWGLARVEQITSYRWTADLTLSYTSSAGLPFLRSGALPVPPEHRDVVQALLESHGVPREGQDA
jgi:hypothetical protein